MFILRSKEVTAMVLFAVTLMGCLCTVWRKGKFTDNRNKGKFKETKANTRGRSSLMGIMNEGKMYTEAKRDRGRTYTEVGQGRTRTRPN